MMISPSLEGSSPINMASKVDLPDPFGPTNP
jgi:hypothetical protein